jgi:two-component system OmpR family sensor kinase
MSGVFVFRRALFWRVYLTLLASLTLAAVLAALAWHNRIIIQHQAHMRHSMHLPMMLLLIAAAVGLGAYPAVARLTHRLERLKTSVDAWGEGRLDVRAEVQGRDEVAGVAASFNAAAERVERLMAAHRDLLAHASHELRSPLARLTMAVEMYSSRPDPALRPQIMADIEELSALVDEILLASRLDQSELAREPVDCLELAAEEAARAGVAVRRVGPDDASLVVAGTPRLIRRMIRNLVENALKHGAPPVEVSVETIASGSSVAIAVGDRGPGLEAADRERVFEPFYRPAGRAETDGSWGLGLSIVRQIAQGHGGTVVCRPREGGVEFVVTLPTQP